MVAVRDRPVSEQVLNLSDEKHLTANDAARLLYVHGIGSIAVSIIASTFLLWISLKEAPQRLLWGWWGLMIAVLLVRSVDVFLWHSRARKFRMAGYRDIRRFGLGLLMAAT